ncbi:MAG TPA: hypothetical protein VFT43_10010 [Candidatus Polarisedimenticolia bacterium]|nr:hypothetical protein [Candidatus Polarisedimenticolia bacterium]
MRNGSRGTAPFAPLGLAALAVAGAVIGLLLAASVATSSAAPTAPASTAEQKVAPGWDRLKSLVGEWQGSGKNGKTVNLSYRLVSGGTVLMETIDAGGGEENMVTMYHPDGDHLMMTHYCAANNQPRMRAEKSNDPRSISFNFVDATNMAGANTPHMHHLVMTFPDDDHLTEKWTFRDNGKDAMEEVFTLARKK